VIVNNGERSGEQLTSRSLCSKLCFSRRRFLTAQGSAPSIYGLQWHVCVFFWSHLPQPFPAGTSAASNGPISPGRRQCPHGGAYDFAGMERLVTRFARTWARLTAVACPPPWDFESNDRRGWKVHRFLLLCATPKKATLGWIRVFFFFLLVVWFFVGFFVWCFLVGLLLVFVVLLCLWCVCFFGFCLLVCVWVIFFGVLFFFSFVFLFLLLLHIICFVFFFFFCLFVFLVTVFFFVFFFFCFLCCLFSCLVVSRFFQSFVFVSFFLFAFLFSFHFLLARAGCCGLGACWAQSPSLSIFFFVGFCCCGGVLYTFAVSAIARRLHLGATRVS